MIADFEIRIRFTDEAVGEGIYTADVFAFWYDARSRSHKKIDFEVDGFKGHNSTRQINRDKRRSERLGQKGIKTVRVNMLDLVGKRKVDDDTIEADILWQLSR